MIVTGRLPAGHFSIYDARSSSRDRRQSGPDYGLPD